MAEIHLAKTKGIAGFEKYVALKMIHPNFAEDDQFIGMLIDEAKIAVQLNHGNIAQTFDLGRVGDTYYITMEYVDGSDLYKILRRSSEIDYALPLDVCAFIAKEIASALDHAHRKRDHAGKTLGIVHRDVSPQNVLISYSGEIKLVDFGIAKATMKARQTAVGVIKGKYYYMSPEQAWGEPIDARSDIFSVGIVLYEMITGQMLYLEEDLHKLLDMARKADIAPPSTLRKGIPPQLERIVMHALDRDKRTRYQSAADFATDLERFLHAYSPVFTATKVAALVKQIIGDPMEVPYDADNEHIEMRDGPTATHTLTSEDLILDKEELRDENSVIFRLNQLEPPPEPEPPKRERRPTGTPQNRVTRQADINDIAPPMKIPSVIPRKQATPNAGSRQVGKPRGANEETRQVSQPAPPSGNTEDSGLLEFEPPKPAWKKPDTDGQGESTMITGPSFGGGFMMDVASEEGVDATIVSAGPPVHEEHDPHDEDGETINMRNKPGAQTDDEVPTVQRDFRDAAQPRSGRAPAPPALAAQIHAPAVSELRKPRASRKTPQGGVPQSNVLQAIVGSKPSEPMPSPRPERNEDSGAATLPQQPSPVAGLPPPQPVSQQPYNGQQPYYPGYPQYPQFPQYQQQAGYPQMSPQALYQLQPQGAPPPQQMSLTGQMRLFEADEINPAYKVTGGPRWIKLVIAGVLAVSVAAGVTFFIIKSTRESAPSVATVRIDSVPPGAEVVFDGTRLAGSTPMTVDSVPVGTRHEIKVEVPRHKPYIETIDIPKSGGDVTVKAFLTALTGKIRVNSRPPGAEIRIDNRLYGYSPMTINGIDIATAKTIELRLKDYQPFTKTLEWPANAEINIDAEMPR